MSHNIQWINKAFNDLSLDELYTMMTLRQEVFVVEQDCPYIDADGKDQYSHHLMGFDESGALVAYTRIVAPGISYKEVSIGRVITAQSVRGIGLGVVLMEKSIEAVAELYGKVPIRISAQEHLRKFYESLGFVYTGKSYLEDGIPHIDMLRGA